MSVTRYTISGSMFYGYVSVDEADKYFSTVVNTWNDLDSSTDDKQTLIVNASRRIDLLRYKSTPVKEYKPKSSGSDTTQPLKFPRVEFDLPYDVELACIILAGEINIDATQQFVSDVNLNLKKVKAGSVEIEFYETTDIELAQNELSIVNPTVRALLAPYLALGLPVEDTGAIEAGEAYGTDGISLFREQYRYYRF